MKTLRCIILVITTALSVQAQNSAERQIYCSDAGSTDAYSCTPPVSIGSYLTGRQFYTFIANTANTGAATINLGPGVKTIKKRNGGALIDLATGDICAGQIVVTKYDGTNMQMVSPSCTSGGASDGDKGDITVSSSSSVWTIDNDVVTYAKMQNVSVTDKLLGRSTAGAGDVEEISCDAICRALLDDTSTSAQRTTLGLAIGTNVQAWDADLDAIAGLAATVGVLSRTGAGAFGLVAGTATDCVLVNGTSGACGAGGSTLNFTLNSAGGGSGTTLNIINSTGFSHVLVDTGTIIDFTPTLDTAVVPLKNAAGDWTAKQEFIKTGNIAALRIVPSIAPVTGLESGDFYTDSTTFLPCVYSGSVWNCAAIDPTTMRGDMITRGASGLSRLAVGATGSVVWSDGTDKINRQLLYTDITNATGTIASGTSALGTSAITSGACATVVTTTATGTATTDVIIGTFNADPTGVTGYAPSANGMLTIIGYPTTNNVNWKACNNTASSITPGAITLNWRVVR